MSQVAASWWRLSNVQRCFVARSESSGTDLGLWICAEALVCACRLPPVGDSEEAAGGVLYIRTSEEPVFGVGGDQVHIARGADLLAAAGLHAATLRCSAGCCPLYCECGRV